MRTILNFLKSLNKSFYIFSALTLICFLYGVNIYRTGYGTLFFLVWILLGFGFMGLYIAIRCNLWSKVPKIIRIVLATVFITGMSVFILVEGLIVSKINAKGEPGLDYIIVLGALVKENGPSSITRARLNSAIKYLSDNPDTICIVSGGQGKNEPFSEAEGMKRYLLENGVASTRVVMEDQSTNTIENILYSKKLLDNEDAKIGIVTSRFHVYRAVQIAKKQGLNNSVGISGYVVPFYMPSNMFREFFGVIKDTYYGNMNLFF